MHQCATFIAVYADWGFARVKGVGWGWGGIIWLYSLVTFFPLDILKFITRYVLSGRGWENITENKVISIDRNIYIYIYIWLLLWININKIRHGDEQTAFTSKKDYGREEREAQWATAQRTLHGLQTAESTTNIFPDKGGYRELSEIAEQAKRRAEVAR